MSQRQKLIKKL